IREDAARLSRSSPERARRLFGGGAHSSSQDRIARRPTQSEDGRIVSRDDVHGATRAPYLDEPGILPSGRRDISYACVKRQDGRSRGAVLKPCERGFDESPWRKAPVQVRRTLPEREHLLPSD